MSRFKSKTILRPAQPRSKWRQGTGAYSRSYSSDSIGGDYLERQEFYNLFKLISPETEDGQPYILANYGISSLGDLQAFGRDAESGEAGGGGSVIDLLTSWDDYKSETENFATSAKLVFDSLAKKLDATALSGYATEKWVTSKNFLTSHNLADYYTKDEIATKFNDGSVKYAVSAWKLVNNPTLWGQTFNGYSAVSGNMWNVGKISFTSGYKINPYSSEWITLFMSDWNAGKVAMGGLLITDVYDSGFLKVPKNGIYSKGGIITDGSLIIGNIVLRDAGGYLEIDSTLVATGDVLAFGATVSGGSAAAGSFDILGDWTDYGESTKDFALAAKLGYGMLTDISSLTGRVSALEGKNYLSSLSLTQQGSGNAVTDIALSADKTSLTVTKDATYALASDLTDYIKTRTNATLGQLFVQTGADSKIVLDNIDDDTYWTLISFREKGVEYGSLGTTGSDVLVWNGSPILNKSNFAGYLDTRYYTETESDAKYLSKTGGTMTGSLTMANGSALIGVSDGVLNDTAYGYITVTRTVVPGVNKSFFAMVNSMSAPRTIGLTPEGYFIFGGGYGGNDKTMNPWITFTKTHIDAPAFHSTVATGTAPLSVASTTRVTNLNADLLDGLHDGELTSKRLTVYENDRNHDSVVTKPSELVKGILVQFRNPTGANSTAQWNTLVSLNGFAGGKSSGAGYRHQLLFFDSIDDPHLLIRNGVDDAWNAWNEVAFTSDNVASATKLKTARMLWGNSFDGSGDITGSMTVDGSVTAKALISPELNLKSTMRNSYFKLTNEMAVGAFVADIAYMYNYINDVKQEGYIVGFDGYDRQTLMYNALVSNRLTFGSNGYISGDIRLGNAGAKIYLDLDNNVWIRYNRSKGVIEASHTIVSAGDIQAFGEAL